MEWMPARNLAAAEMVRGEVRRSVSGDRLRMSHPQVLQDMMRSSTRVNERLAGEAGESSMHDEAKEIDPMHEDADVIYPAVAPCPSDVVSL